MLESYFIFSGRLNRKPFIIRLLAIFALFGIAIMGFVFAIQSRANFSLLFLILGIILVVVGIIAVCAISLRRIHDLDKPTWWILALLIQIPVNFLLPGLLGYVNFLQLLFMLYLSIAKGTDGPNQHGEDPLKIENN